MGSFSFFASRISVDDKSQYREGITAHHSQSASQVDNILHTWRNKPCSRKAFPQMMLMARGQQSLVAQGQRRGCRVESRGKADQGKAAAGCNAVTQEEGALAPEEDEGDGDNEPGEKALEMMRKFSEQYAKRTGTYFCMDKGVTATVIKGLAQHKEELGAPLCPCRHYDDKEAEVKNGFWNCPCIPMRCVLWLSNFAFDRLLLSSLCLVSQLRHMFFFFC